MIDETTSPARHRAIAMARLLMYDHPRVGAARYDLELGELQGYEVGWNQVRREGGRTLYVEIAPDGGHTTFQRPDVPASQIHVVDREPPELQASRAWQAFQALSTQGREGGAADHAAAVEFAAVVPGVTRAIQSFGARPLGPDGGIDEFIATWLARTQARVADGATAGEAVAHSTFELVQRYLDLRVTGRFASRAMSVLFWGLVMESATDLTTASLQIVDQMDLLNVAAGLSRETRPREDLTSRCWHAYVALLLCQTVGVMGRELSEALPPDSTLRQRCEGAWQYADEMIAGDFGKLLVEPQRHFPLTPDELARAGRGGDKGPGDDWESVVAAARVAPERFEWTEAAATELTSPLTS